MSKTVMNSFADLSKKEIKAQFNKEDSKIQSSLIAYFLQILGREGRKEGKVFGQQPVKFSGLKIRNRSGLNNNLLNF